MNGIRQFNKVKNNSINVVFPIPERHKEIVLE